MFQPSRRDSSLQGQDQGWASLLCSLCKGRASRQSLTQFLCHGQRGISIPYHVSIPLYNHCNSRYSWQDSRQDSWVRMNLVDDKPAATRDNGMTLAYCKSSPLNCQACAKQHALSMLIVLVLPILDIFLRGALTPQLPTLLHSVTVCESRFSSIYVAMQPIPMLLPNPMQLINCNA